MTMKIPGRYIAVLEDEDKKTFFFILGEFTRLEDARTRAEQIAGARGFTVKEVALAEELSY
jgi:hypothetical protein